MENKKVLLGMSGGVDSSVAAILLQNQGYEVIGVTLELLPNGNSKNMIEDAKKVCDKLHIKHFVLSLQDEFKKYVIDDFINCYSNCSTPNPCIECNKYIKFGLMYEKAKELGCNYIATGHYAKIEYNNTYNSYVLKKSQSRKDQSYFLYNIPNEMLSHILFPLSEFEDKSDIRKIAKDYDLDVQSKKDSEDICFIKDQNYKRFLEESTNIQSKEGNIVNREGKILGKHNGLYNYTIGQRKGLGIAYKEPLFVVNLDKQKDEVIAGTENELYRNEFEIKEYHFILNEYVDRYFKENKENGLKVLVKIRYAAKEAEAYIYLNKNTKSIIVKLQEPQKGITKGQSAVFYIDDIVLGGGKII